MYPYHPSSARFNLGTFGLFLWLAAVRRWLWSCYLNFIRDGVDADALNIVALVVLAGVLGAKTWHELQDPGELAFTGLQSGRLPLPGWSPSRLDVILGFLGWTARAGIAWYRGPASPASPPSSGRAGKRI